MADGDQPKGNWRRGEFFPKNSVYAPTMDPDEWNQLTNEFSAFRNYCKTRTSKNGPLESDSSMAAGDSLKKKKRNKKIIWPNKKYGWTPLDCKNPNITKYLKNEEHKIIYNRKYCGMQDVFEACEQVVPIPMRVILKTIDRVKKVGESDNSEVYMVVSNGRTMVYKILPIEGMRLGKQICQKDFSTVLQDIYDSEYIKTLQELTQKPSSRGLVKRQNIRLTIGQFSRTLVSEWNSWHWKNRNKKANNLIKALF